MGNFTPTVKEQASFDGDDIALVLRRLKTKHTLILSPHIRPADTTGDVKLAFTEFAEMAEKAGQILPDCVVEMSGLKDSAGQALQLGDILSEAYFQPLVVEILMKLMMHSSVGAAAAKNSAAPLPAPSTAPAPIEE